MSIPYKKILFISCSSGTGHVRVAEALHLYCKANYPEITSAHFDLAEFSSFLLKKSATSGYAFMVRYLPRLFKAIYTFADSPWRARGLYQLSPLIRLQTKKLMEQVDAFAPDRIVCTHFLAPPLLKKYAGKIPIDVVVTDYYANQIWLSPFVRRYFVAHQHTLDLLDHNLKNAVVSGLPLFPNFLQNKNAEEIKKKLGLANGRPTVLLLSGGQGLSDTSRAAKEILANAPDINLVAFSGSDNQKIYDKLFKLTKQKNAGGGGLYKVLKFSSEIDEWMRASEIIITKPGGLTVAECLYLQKPLLLINPIPGQEEKNAEFLEKNNYGKWARHSRELPRYIKTVLKNPNFFNKQIRSGLSPNRIIIEG